MQNTNKLPQTKNSSWAFHNDSVNNWAYWDKAFTPEECQQIIEIGESRIPTKGVAMDADEGYRECDIAWLYACDDLEWVFRRITDISISLNDRFFKFDLFGLVEGLQFTKYNPSGDKYGAHLDTVLNGTVRKLSLSLQLSPDTAYKGGNLLLHTSGKPIPMSREQGYVAVFPSYILHEVTPVTSGTRYSLVTWVTGKPFK
jgi:PKHD-type hydroxylase